jgi:Flp pilus assembly protein TadB
VRASDEPPEHERVDRVALVVVTLFFLLFVCRGVISALIDGEQVGVALLAAGLGLVSVGIVLLPAWRHRRTRRRRLGRL